jgi:hypothetical protein
MPSTGVITGTRTLIRSLTKPFYQQPQGKFGTADDAESSFLTRLTLSVSVPPCLAWPAPPASPAAQAVQRHVESEGPGTPMRSRSHSHSSRSEPIRTELMIRRLYVQETGACQIIPPLFTDGFAGYPGSANIR